MDSWQEQNKHFPHYIKNQINLEIILRKMVRQLRRVHDKKKIIETWYNEIHEENNRSRWWKTIPVNHWDQWLSFHLLDEAVTRLTLKFFLNDVYEKENLMHTSIHFHHIVKSLAHHLCHIPSTIQPDTWLDEYYDTK